MEILNSEDFLKKYNLKDKTMNESELRRVYNYSIYSRDSLIYSDKGFVKIDDCSMRGTHWTCFIVKITNHFTVTHLEVSQINFYYSNYLNQ